MSGFSPRRAPASEQPSRHSLGAFLLVVGAALVATIGIAAGIIQLSAGPAPTAQDVAEEYLGHIARGEAAAANSMAAPDDDIATLLTDDVLSAAVAHISDVEVTPRGGSNDDSAWFDVTYHLAGSEYSGSLELENREQPGGAPAVWAIVTPFVQTSHLWVSGEGGVALSGVVLEQIASDRPGARVVTLYPAVYAFESLSMFFEPEPDVMVLGTGYPPPQDIVMIATEVLTEAVQARSDELLQRCAHRTAEASECPYEMDWEQWADPHEWAVVELPTVQLFADGSGFSLSGGSFTITSPSADGGWAQPIVEEYTPVFSGHVKVDGNEVTVTFSSDTT